MPRILLADNEPFSRLVAQIRLEGEGHEVLVARTATEAWRMMHNYLPIVVLLDNSLPDCDGLRFLEEKKGSPVVAEIPVLLAVEYDQEAQIRERALSECATDVVGKPYQREELATRVRLAANARLASLDLEAKNRQLEQMANHDPLTGLLNRRAFYERWDLERYRVARNNQAISALAIDIDFFKRINDNWGHQTGDQMLELLSQTITANTREQDVCARLGGEEFLILLPQMNTEQALAFGQRLLATFSATAVLQNGEPVTFSAGVAGSDVARLEMMLKLADDALYAAKRQGRDRVVVWTKEMAR